MDINERINRYMMEGADKQAQIEKIFDFFEDNPSPKDKQVHKLAESMGMDEHQFEETIYFILGAFIGHGEAKKKGITPDKVDAEQLRMGIKVEKEHTSCIVVAERIALDHLAELPDYYTRLAKMEGEH